MTCTAWPVTWPCDTTDVDPTVVEQAVELAGQLLWALSGYRIGVCQFHEGIYPQCGDTCVAPYKGSDGLWYNGGIADCCKLLLAHRPVQAVSEVKVLGVTLDPGDYTVQGGYLKRRFSCWPCAWECDDAPIEVRYEAGVPFPSGTGLVVGEVACEYVQALQGRVCKLPSRATNISRQGVNVQLASPEEFVKAGKIGLPMADAWLTTVNRGALQSASKVFSPDLPKAYAIRA